MNNCHLLSYYVINESLNHFSISPYNLEDENNKVCKQNNHYC